MEKKLKVNDDEATIHYHMKTKKINQKKIAEATGLSRTGVCLAIKGEVRLASAKKLIVNYINSLSI